jgi:hypothetical protein
VIFHLRKATKAVPAAPEHFWFFFSGKILEVTKTIWQPPESSWRVPKPFWLNGLL